MNLRTTLTVAAVALMISCCIPIVTDGSDAAEKQRTSNLYIYEGTFEKTTDAPIYPSFLCFIDDSPDHEMMKRYLADPTNASVSIDDSADREKIMTSGWTGTVHVYRWYSYNYGDSYEDDVSNDGHIVLTKVLDPYGSLVFFVKAGDTIRISMTATDYKGAKVIPFIYTTVGISYINPDLEYECLKPTEVVIKFQADSPLYIDVTYDVRGNSMPNGSATAYVSICAAITIMVLAIMIFASLKPRWSK